MKSFLKALAQDQIQTLEIPEVRDPRRQQLIEKSYKFLSELEPKLKPEEKELLTHLLDTNTEESVLYAEDRFIQGYRLGVLMTMEVFEGLT